MRAGILTALLALHLAGCAEVPCPGGCPAGQLCDEATGRCVPPPDCTVIGCPEPDEVCDALTLECRRQGDCLSDGCPAGQWCNARTHRCEARPGCVVSGCPADHDCDPTDGQCRRRPCGSDEACPPGEVCLPSGECVPGCRADRPCADGQVCSVASSADEGPGRCLSGCRDEADCPHGETCRPDAEATPLPGLCAPEPPCGVHADCRADEICDRGSCVRGPCTEGVPCPPDAFCDPETGDCLAGGCEDDIFEDNDDADSAVLILAQDYTQLRLCPGDQDWYLVRPGPGSLVEAALRLDPARGDLDLVAYDPDLYELAASRTTGSPESVQARTGPSGDLLLQVAGHGGASNVYMLEIDVLPSPACEEDALSPNHSFRAPRALGAGTWNGLVLCPRTEDWYALALEAGDGLEVSLAAAPGSLPALALLGPDGSSETATPRGELSGLRVARVPHDGGHLLRVGPAGDEPIAYDLDVRRYPDGLPCRDDDLEDNDNLETASPLGGRTYSALVACPGDPDWYSLDLERPGGVAEVRLEATSPSPVVLPVLSAFGPDGAQALPSGAEAGLAVVVGPVAGGGPVHVRVALPRDALPVTYDLHVAITPGPEPCRDDTLEPEGGNDGAARAVTVRPGVVEGLVLCPESPEDWYAADVAEGGALRLRVEGEDVRCALRTPDGARLLQACEASGESVWSVAKTGLARGRYRLHVHAEVQPPGLPYRLELEVIP